MRFWLTVLTLTTAFGGSVPLYIIDVLMKDFGALISSVLKMTKPIRPDVYGGGIDTKGLLVKQYDVIRRDIRKTRADAEKKYRNVKLPDKLKRKLDRAEQNVKQLEKALSDHTATMKPKGPKTINKNSQARKSFASKKPKNGKKQNKNQKKQKTKN